MRRRAPLLVCLVGVWLASVDVTPARQAATIPAGLFGEMHWRSIGPFRASRTRSGSGHRSQPFTFYAAAVNGGVWKTTDAGRTWAPIFDDQPTQSVGTVVVAPSDPNVIYVGSGEGLPRPDLSVGDGVYKSTDAGRTWTHLGLRDAQQIANIAVDPRDANRLFVAALGHPYGPNAERGIYRSTDGGRTFEQVLGRDENTGGNDVDIDPTNSDIVYATLWEQREGPWENAKWGGHGGIFKSTDGGTTWRPLAAGLPADGIIQANLSIAPSSPSRIYASIAHGTPPSGQVNIYRSNDGGESWIQITTDGRPAGRIGGGDLSVPIVQPNNPDIVIMASTVSWKSIDGGRSWAPYKGAPGGEDYQGGWINPDNPDIVLLVADQGAVVTLNGGESWSAWYNQPTAAMYHVAADNAFPYRVCSGQQESGSACVSSRGNYGAVSVRDWLPVGVDEYGYVAPDPLNPNLVYGGRSVTRFDWRTGQVSTVGPVGGRGGGASVEPGLTFRQVRTMPVVFSEADKRALFFGNNYLWKTIDGGINWQRLSPDLTRETYALPSGVGKYASEPSAAVTQRGVIYTIGPSYRDINRIWIGTDDGLIHTTADGGKTWQNVTPPQMGPWWKVFMMEPGRFDVNTAYAAVNTLRLDDMRPHIYRTHDAGKTWTEIVTGLDGAGPANAVREDPKRRGLLYASTEKSVYVSFDDGAHWHSLRQNLPASSVRDIIVKDDDLVAATHGRGFWILDDVTPLRQIDEATLGADATLFAPTTAWRVRWNTSTDMPWPKEEPVGQNPPDGVFVNYHLKAAATGPVVLEVLTADGRLVRRYSSADPVPALPDPASAPVPMYWYAAPRGLATSAGLHRFVWDVHYQPLAGGGGGGRGGLPISAIPGRTAPGPSTPWVSPGTYTLRLTVNGRSQTQSVTVRQDPRVTTPATVMQQVYSLTDAMYFGAVEAQAAAADVQTLRAEIATRKGQAQGAIADALTAFDARAEALAGAAAAGAGGGRGGRGGGRGAAPAGGRGGGRGAPAGPPDTLAEIASTLAGQMNALQSADVQPTATQVRAMTEARQAAQGVMARWTAMKGSELAALNARLRTAGLQEISIR